MKKLLLLSLLSISLFSCSNDDENAIDENAIWDHDVAGLSFSGDIEYKFNLTFQFLSDSIVNIKYVWTLRPTSTRSEDFEFFKKNLPDSTVQITFYDNEHYKPFVGIINNKASQMVLDGDYDREFMIAHALCIIKKGTIFNRN